MTLASLSLFVPGILSRASLCDTSFALLRAACLQYSPSYPCHIHSVASPRVAHIKKPFSLVFNLMAIVTWEDELQGLPNGFSVDEGTVVLDFVEYTFRAPRPGFFLGDSLLGPGEYLSPVFSVERENSERIPSCASTRPFLGILDTLATELLCQIFSHLDMYSLLIFRRVNRYAKEVVDALPLFRSIAAFPKLLGAAEALQCRSWTVTELVRCLFDEQCSMCREYGDLLYLVTPERWCYDCWHQKSQLVVQRVPSHLKTREDILRACPNIPYVRLSAGFYGTYGNGFFRKPHFAYDMRALQNLLPEAANWPRECPQILRHLRYTTVIRGPYWDPETGSFEEGYFCRACSSQGWLFRINRPPFPGEYPVWELPWRRYTRVGIKSHIARYGPVFKIKTALEEIRYVHGKPFTELISRYPGELWEIGPILHGCRETEFQFPTGAPFISGWCHVPSDHEVKEIT